MSRINIKKKLLGMFIVLLIIPGIVISVFGYLNSKSGLKESTEKGLKNSVQLASGVIESQNSLVEAGVLSLEEAQEEVKRQLIGNQIDEKTRDMEVGFEFEENGYFVIFDNEGNTIAHPSIEGENVWEEEFNGTFFMQEMIKEAENGGGFTYYDFPMPDDSEMVKEKIAYSQVSPHWDWIIGVNVYTHEYNSHTDSLIMNASITLVITVIIGMLFGNFFVNYLSKSINQIMIHAQQIANGNLSISDLNIKNDDELGVLAKHFNNMLVNLKEMIGQTSDTSQQVASTSEQLSVGSEQTNNAIEQNSSSIQDVVNDAEQQSSHAKEAVKVVDDMVETIQHVTSQVNEVTLASDETIKTAVTGNQTVNEAGKQMTVIDQVTETLKNAIQGLEDRSNQIGNIISLITNVTEQTNLLALNASIEAARAGEYGQGFSIVADEIRSLAEQSAVATDDVKALIIEIQNSVEQANRSYG